MKEVAVEAFSHSFFFFLSWLAGQSGLGKSTLMNTLFKSKVSRKSVLATAQEKIPKTVEIKSISHGTTWLFLCAAFLTPFCPSAFSLLVYLVDIHLILLSSTPVCCSFAAVLALSVVCVRFLFADIEEKGVRMKLTVIDTPGFGDQINNENW